MRYAVPAHCQLMTTQIEPRKKQFTVNALKFNKYNDMAKKRGLRIRNTNGAYWLYKNKKCVKWIYKIEKAEVAELTTEKFGAIIKDFTFIKTDIELFCSYSVAVISKPHSLRPVYEATCREFKDIIHVSTNRAFAFQSVQKTALKRLNPYYNEGKLWKKIEDLKKLQKSRA